MGTALSPRVGNVDENAHDHQRQLEVLGFKTIQGIIEVGKWQDSYFTHLQVGDLIRHGLLNEDQDKRIRVTDDGWSAIDWYANELEKAA